MKAIMKSDVREKTAWIDQEGPIRIGERYVGVGKGIAVLFMIRKTARPSLDVDEI